MIYNCQIVYNQNNCLNAKRASDNLCRLCIDSCPHQAISIYRKLDAKRCTECGICTAVCPSDGFVYRDTDTLYEYLKNSEKIVLNCPQAIPVGHEIPCLGIFDRDLPSYPVMIRCTLAPAKSRQTMKQHLLSALVLATVLLAGTARAAAPEDPLIVL